MQSASCAEDVDRDGDVDVADLLSLLTAFGAEGSPRLRLPEDIDGNGLVDVADLLSLLGRFGPSCVSHADDVCDWSGAGLRWTGDDGTVFVVHANDFNKNTCQDGRHAILTAEGCSAAIAAFRLACGGGPSDVMSELTGGDTKGCHVHQHIVEAIEQLGGVGGVPEWRFNKQVTQNGCKHDFHPICTV